MMEGRKKIKDLYDCEYIVSDTELFPLQIWYNRLIDKTLSEVNVSDILHMIRQKQFLNIAIKKAIDFLRSDVFVGELYDGQLLEKISELDIFFLEPYKDIFITILKDAKDKAEKHEWSYDGEKDEILECVDYLLKRLLNDIDKEK